MHTYKVNKILNFKVMGLSGYDQTACLAGVAHYAAEGHFDYQRALRTLTKEPKRTDKNEYIEKTKKFKVFQKS